MIAISTHKAPKNAFRIVQNDTTAAHHVGGSVPLQLKPSDRMIFWEVTKK